MVSDAFSPVRNVYLLINYGNFIPCASTPCPDRDAPYIQLMATAPSPSVMHDDFVRARLHHSPLSLPIWAIVVIAIVGAGVLLGGIALASMCIARRRKNRNLINMVDVTRSDTKTRGAYTPVDAPVEREMGGRPAWSDGRHLRSASLGFDPLGGETLESRYSRYPTFSSTEQTLKA
jgi:hypothetical protein